MKFSNKYLRNLSPYRVASHKIWEVDANQRKEILKLDWNEATIPPTPLVFEKLKKLIEEQDTYFLYPSTYNPLLMELLSKYCSLPEENIQYFASSDSLHEYFVRMYISVGDPILILGPTYDNFRLTCEAQGGIVYIEDYNDDFTFDEGNFINAIDNKQPSLVYICNPNNPTGNVIDDRFIIELLIKYPDIIFLIDEAYYEFYEKTLAKEVIKFSNLFISRTFSKAFALANFRAGYLLSNKENINQISKIRNAKNFTTFAQEAVIAVLSDIEYMKGYVEEVKKAKLFFINSMLRLNIIENVYNSEGNFVLVKFKSDEIKNNVYNSLIDNNIFVRNLTHSKKLIGTLRITIGTTSQMERVLEVISK
jgi:histidinol-phosphate aminotransferase